MELLGAILLVLYIPRIICTVPTSTCPRLSWFPCHTLSKMVGRCQNRGLFGVFRITDHWYIHEPRTAADGLDKGSTTEGCGQCGQCESAARSTVTVLYLCFMGQ